MDCLRQCLTKIDFARWKHEWEMEEKGRIEGRLQWTVWDNESSWCKGEHHCAPVAWHFPPPCLRISLIACFISDSLPHWQGETQIPQNGSEGLSWSWFSTCVLWLPHIRSHPSCLSLHLQRSLCTCLLSIWNAFPSIPLDSHSSQYKLRNHSYQKRLPGPLN